MSRATFSSPLGAFLVLTGMAVGLGNVWRFPYMVGAFGGGAFLLVYLLLLAAFGIPAVMAELTLGRHTRQAVGSYTQIGMRGGRAIGIVLFVTILMAVSYYTVVVAWVLRYLVGAASGALMEADPGRNFDSMLNAYGSQIGATMTILIGVAVVLIWGVRKGIERMSRVATPVLFVLLLILLGRTLSMPGTGDGLRFYLVPDFTKLNAGVFAAALGQMFFSLGLGGTLLVTYASYLPDDANLKHTALSMSIAETLVAIIAGLAIVPAAMSLGVELESGPPLIFIAVPTILQALPLGALFGVMFFGLLFLAAFLSVVAAFEVVVASMIDGFGWTRRRAALTFCTIGLLLGIPAIVSVDYITTSDLFWGSVMHPVGSVCAIVALAWVVGQAKALEEVNRGNDGVQVSAFWIFYLRWIVPAGIVTILALGVRDLFAAF